MNFMLPWHCYHLPIEQAVLPPAASGLTTALSSRSHKGEVILTTCSAGRMLTPLLQTVRALELLGVDNVLPLAKDAAVCTAVAAQLPHVGCAFSSVNIVPPKDDTEQPAAKIALFFLK